MLTDFRKGFLTLILAALVFVAATVPAIGTNHPVEAKTKRPKTMIFSTFPNYAPTGYGYQVHDESDHNQLVFAENLNGASLGTRGHFTVSVQLLIENVSPVRQPLYLTVCLVTERGCYSGMLPATTLAANTGPYVANWTVTVTNVGEFTEQRVINRYIQGTTVADNGDSSATKLFLNSLTTRSDISGDFSFVMLAVAGNGHPGLPGFRVTVFGVDWESAYSE